MTRQILDYTTNPSNPYYLSSNENPTMVLVPSLLTESNYHEWARSMQTSLLSKNKLQFVDGSLPQPPLGDPMHDTWNRCNQMVVSWLRNAMTVSMAKSVLWIDLAVDVWNDVRNRFSQGDNFRIATLQEEIFGLKQGDMTVSEYSTRLKTFWEELEMFEPLPQCSCVNHCDAVTRARTYRTTNYIIRFLRGLNEQYSQVRSQVMLMDPMPSIPRVLSLIVQQEDGIICYWCCSKKKILSCFNERNLRYLNYF